jgi:catechol 2,3-dioxygenase-like lactoylglutathione lyase family enzyme|tara:strand:+ start:276 stop:719 length:444 start_codon:yes stop_codon:yes gene_type:complete
MALLRHVGLLVKDIDRSLRLYQDVFNFIPKVDQIESDEFFHHLVGIENSSARTVKCYSSMDDSCLELIQYITPSMLERSKSINALGFNHIAINVIDMEQVCSSLSSLGLEFLSKPMINTSKTVIVGFCRDFEGNLLELVETLDVSDG